MAVWTLTSKRVLKREKPWSALPLADNCSSNVWESPQPLPVIQSNKTIRLCTSMSLVYNTHMGEEYPTEAWLCPALPTCSRAPCSSIFTSELAFSSASPPVHHQYYYTIVLSARNVFRRTLNRFAMQCWFSTALLGWLLGSDVSKEVSLNKSLSTLLSVRSSNRFNRKN